MKKWNYAADIDIYVDINCKSVIFFASEILKQRKLEKTIKEVVDDSFIHHTLINSGFKLKLEDGKLKIWLDDYKYWFTIRQACLEDLLLNLPPDLTLTGGELSGGWVAVFNSYDPRMISFVSEESQTYLDILSNSSLALIGKSGKRTRKFEPGHLYESSLGIFVYLGEFGSHRGATPKDNDFQDVCKRTVHFVSFGLDTDKYKTVSEVIENLPFATEEDPDNPENGYITVYSQIPMAYDFGEVITSDLGNYENHLENIFKIRGKGPENLRDLRHALDFCSCGISQKIPLTKETKEMGYKLIMKGCENIIKMFWELHNTGWRSIADPYKGIVLGNENGNKIVTNFSSFADAVFSHCITYYVTQASTIGSNFNSYYGFSKDQVKVDGKDFITLLTEITNNFKQEVDKLKNPISIDDILDNEVYYRYRLNSCLVINIENYGSKVGKAITEADIKNSVSWDKDGNSHGTNANSNNAKVDLAGVLAEIANFGLGTYGLTGFCEYRRFINHTQGHTKEVTVSLEFSLENIKAIYEELNKTIPVEVVRALVANEIETIFINFATV